MISLLCPSRGRPGNLSRLQASLTRTTECRDWELIVRIDADDPATAVYPGMPRTTYLTGPRVVLAEMWNEAWRAASGDIFGLVGDDLTFDTPGWDRLVADAFPPDGIAYVHGDDLGGKGDRLGTHGFVTRAWTDTVGTFVPPYFTSDYVDQWLNDVADAIGRRVFLPGLITEHHHPGFDKAEPDATYTEKWDRHRAGDVDAVWYATAAERVEWADKLTNVIVADALEKIRRREAPA